MSYRLARVSGTQYASAVLPHTHELWGRDVTFEAYVARTAAFAKSPYGRKHFSTHALTLDGEILASFKRYEREAFERGTALHAMGIGAVFTEESLRGRGYATAMLAMALDEARKAGIDFAYLYSDIRPKFYEEIGFVELPSRAISVRADNFPPHRVTVERVSKRDWMSLRPCFSAMQAYRECGFSRSAAVWSMIAMREELGDHFLIRKRDAVVAYVLGRREPQHDAYILGELAYSGEDGARAIGPLLRSAAGDLQRVAGWLPPLPARSILPRGAVRKRTSAIFMAAPLTAGGKAFVSGALKKNAGDTPWHADHV